MIADTWAAAAPLNEEFGLAIRVLKLTQEEVKYEVRRENEEQRKDSS